MIPILSSWGKRLNSFVPRYQKNHCNILFVALGKTADIYIELNIRD